MAAVAYVSVSVETNKAQEILSLLSQRAGPTLSTLTSSFTLCLLLSRDGADSDSWKGREQEACAVQWEFCGQRTGLT